MKNADVPHLEVGVKNIAWNGGGGTPKNLGGRCAANVLKQLHYFGAQYVIFFYPVSGLTQNLTPLIKTVPKRIATT